MGLCIWGDGRLTARFATVAVLILAWAFVSGCGTSAPVCTDQTQARPTDDLSLGKQFEPTVKISILDRFWPTSVEAVMNEQNWLGGRVTLVSRRGTFTPPAVTDLTASDTTTAYLEYPASLTDKAAQMRVFLRGAGVPDSAIYSWPTNLFSYASKSAAIYFYDAGTHCSYAGRNLTGYRALEYWFFYALNYYPMTVNTQGMLTHPLQTDGADIDFHEGDWEHITVLLTPGGLPRYVWMARHSSEGVLLRWDQIQKDAAGHPIVYPAFGGHPSYPTCGAHPRALLAASVYDYVVCSSGLYSFDGATTKLVNLSTASWSCWPGHFGTTLGTTASSNADDPSGAILVGGPGTPLRQGENTNACPPTSG